MNDINAFFFASEDFLLSAAQKFVRALPVIQVIPTILCLEHVQTFWQVAFREAEFFICMIIINGDKIVLTTFAISSLFLRRLLELRLRGDPAQL